MKTIVFYDTETTGLPDWKSPSESDHQPHIVQLGAILADEETRKVLSTLDVIIKPDGWDIPEDTVEIHGITQDVARKVGFHEDDIVSLFYQMCQGSKRVAYNRTFDQRMIRIQMKRYGFSESMIDKWGENEDHECAMIMAKNVMKIPPKNRYGYKNPKQEDAYKFFTDKTLQNAHTALADAQACMEIYWAIKDMEKTERNVDSDSPY